ncbi:hypothetical protein [Metabacillus arenae]|uniref:Uncharacterized protein n=1 Tax=Metabacillus arenae TaxID=2771434 RepID=A0A926NPM0_9BACI|nr:hypothetical protein [Metabacillus arenae]MBD1381621.1 hypothetical protein [Metabacillus arenae]
MTKKYNKGSENNNRPQKEDHQLEFAKEMIAGDNSKGNKRNKDQKDKSAKK